MYSEKARVLQKRALQKILPATSFRKKTTMSYYCFLKSSLFYSESDICRKRVIEDSIQGFFNTEYDVEFRQMIRLCPSWLAIDRFMFRSPIWRYLEVLSILIQHGRGSKPINSAGILK